MEQKSYTAIALQDAINAAQELGPLEIDQLIKHLSIRKHQLANHHRDEAIKRIHELASAVGLTPAEVMSYNPGRPPLYQHPTDLSKTWTGKGRPPHWVRDWENSGHSLDECKTR